MSITNVVLPETTPFTNRAFAVANGLTVDAAEKYLRLRTDRWEFIRERTTVPDAASGRKYWTYVYTPDATYVSAETAVALRRDRQRAAWQVVDDAVQVARDAEWEAIAPYLEPAPKYSDSNRSESFGEFCRRNERARERYFAEHPGAREAAAARDAAGEVVYELRNGRQPRPSVVDVALGFRWKDGARQLRVKTTVLRDFLT
jgi:hypothetical protein